MTNEDVLALARAGFTAQQIAALGQVTTPSPSPSPSPATATATDNGTGMDANDVVQKAANQIVTQLQALGINQSNQPPVQTTNDILASIINPPNKEEKKNG